MHSLTIKHRVESDPYNQAVAGFVHRSFPRLTVKTQRQILDILTDVVLGSNQIRYGPKPPVEDIVRIREVLSHVIANKQPIPFMVPWGSEKPDGSPIDVAELSALKTLSCLNDRLGQFYTPGAVFAVRLEDASAPHLFIDNPAGAWETAQKYVGQFRALVNVLELSDVVILRPESLLVTPERFAHEADLVLPAFENYIAARLFGTPEQAQKEFSAVSGNGWQGEPAAETLEFYMHQYGRWYPNATTGARSLILARYFAAALARKRLGVRGDLPEWEGRFIDLSFVPPVPGTDGYFTRRVNYRTLPTSLTSNHLAPWRAKGYLLVDDDGNATPKLASFGDAREYNENEVELKNGGDSVRVRMDYVLKGDATVHDGEPIERRLTGVL